MRGAAVVALLLMAAAARAEKAVPRERSGQDSQSPAETREAAPERTAEPTAAPTSPPREERPEERREARPSTPPPTSAPTQEPTRPPDPTPRSDDRSDAERRHPRPERPAPTAPPPPPSERPPRGERERRDDTRDDRRGHRDHDGERHERERRMRRGHLGPHFHDTHYIPESCDIEAPGTWESADVRPHYDGLVAFRLLVDPPETRVLVDGYYAGTAADFDGVFERLHVPEGCHEITLALPGHRRHRFIVDAAFGRSRRLRHVMRPGHGNVTEDLSDGVCLRRPEPAAMPPSDAGRDFEIERQRWFLAHERLTAVIGLVRGRLASRAAGTTGPLVLRVEARSDGGAVIVSERESAVDTAAGGEFLASYRIDLTPGRYALRLRVRERDTGRSSVVTEPVEVPDLHAADIRVPSVLIVDSMRKAPAQANHPLSALVLEQSLAVPRFGNRFRPTDAPFVLFQFARRAGASAVYASYVIFGPDGAPVARDGRVQADHVRVSPDRAVGAAAFGPLALAGYGPGRYRIVVTATDLDSLVASVEDAWFDVEPVAVSHGVGDR